MTRSKPAPARRRRAKRGGGELLRAEIVDATRQLLAVSPSSEAVSIRAVADAVGVTPPSIYLHFADKDALIGAVVVEVFAELDDAMMAAGGDVGDPLERLRAFGLAYVDFALKHPQHYRVATMDPHDPYCEPAEDSAANSAAPGNGGSAPPVPLSPTDQMLADSAFMHIREAVADCMATGVFAAGDPVYVALQLWAAAHGVASLMITKPYLPWGDPGAMADAVLCAVAVGRATVDQQAQA